MIIRNPQIVVERARGSVSQSVDFEYVSRVGDLRFEPQPIQYFSSVPFTQYLLYEFTLSFISSMFLPHKPLNPADKGNQTLKAKYLTELFLTFHIILSYIIKEYKRYSLRAQKSREYKLTTAHILSSPWLAFQQQLPSKCLCLINVLR